MRLEWMRIRDQRPPMRPGEFYFFRNARGQSVWVVRVDHRGYARNGRQAIPWLNEGDRGWWAGPIPQPSDPEEDA